jgi:hypothetical protein
MSQELALVIPNAPELTMREKVLLAEDEIRKLPPVELPIKHHFSRGDGPGGGVYGREMFIPAGTILTGKIHKYEQLNILSAGEISVLTEEGIKRVKAPFHIVSPPGTKRIAFAHTDCVWTTIHGTDERDVDKIEAHFIAQSEQEWLEFSKALELKEAPCPGAQ